MNRILVFILVIFLIFSCQERQSKKVNKIEVNMSLNDTLKYDLFFKIHLKNYIGKTVGELLENEGIKHYNDYYWSDEPPGKLNSLNLIYPNKINLEIYVYPLKFTPSFSETNNFNIELFKKEKIIKLIIIEDFKETILK